MPMFVVEIQHFELLRFSLPSFYIRYTPCYNNVCADCLAKKTRAQNFLFFYVNTSVSVFLKCMVSSSGITPKALQRPRLGDDFDTTDKRD